MEDLFRLRATFQFMNFFDALFKRNADKNKEAADACHPPPLGCQ